MRKLFTSAILGMAVAAVVLPQPLVTVAAPAPVGGQPKPAGGEGGGGDKHDAAVAEGTQVPVKQVVLYSSGVGYFEHFGTVQGNGSTELRFKTQQINDILKSLVLQDLDGGKVTTVTYPSQDPVGKTLRSFEVDITGNPGLMDLINQLRGARLTITTSQNEEITGTVLGVEKRKEPAGGGGGKDGKGGGGEPVEVSVLNLLSGSGIRSVKLEDARNIQFEDPELRQELERALAALAQARGQDKKPVTIHFRGDGERHVRIGYVVETPIWKTSYRLILAEPGDAGGAGDAAPAGEGRQPEGAGQPKDNPKGTKAPGGPAAGQPAGEGEGAAGAPGGAAEDPPPASLQGWAIVENQTDSDWTDVQLSLVSGRPISFIQDLYQPLYIPRPVVQPELYASLNPQTYEGGLDRPAADPAPFGAPAADAPGAPRPPAEKQEAAQRGGRAAGRSGDTRDRRSVNEELAKAAEVARQPMNAAASVASVASATDLGELFQYTVGNVSLPRQKSAMIPIITDPVHVERLSIFNPTVLAKHPLNGGRVKNTTDKHLLQGPITVLENGAYAGDARIDDVPPGQERLISFGIDQQVRVDATGNKHESSVLSGKIVKGVLQVTRKHVFTQEYLAQNKGERAKTLLIEHPRRPGWELVDTPRPVETTEALYRFQGPLPAGKQTKLTVTEQHVEVEGLAILPADLGTLELYGRTGAIPEPVRAALARAVQMKHAVVETERLIQDRQRQLADITQQQARIRENMKTVQPNTDYYERLAKKLNEQETRIEALQTEAEALIDRMEQQRKAMEDYLAALDVG